MPDVQREPLFQTWLLERMVASELTPMSLAARLGILDGEIENWVAGRSVPTREQCRTLAQLFEVSARDVLSVAGWA